MPKVSVCMVAFNHERFIAEAIEGVLMQETNFDVELVVGEDFSSDHTYSILEGYKKNYPERIKLLSTNENLGMMPNFIRTLKACSGNFIALCDGDDYWTDKYKLQRQVDFLEQNPEYSIHGDNAVVIYDNDSEGHLFSNNDSSTLGLDTIIKGRILPTSGIVFANILPPVFPKWFLSTPFGDTGLIILLTCGGQLVKFCNKPSSVYRKHQGGIMNSFNQIGHFRKVIRFYDEVNSFYNYKYSSIFLERVGSVEFYESEFYFNNKEYIKALLILINSIKHLLKSGNKIGRNHVKLFFKILNKGMRSFIDFN